MERDGEGDHECGEREGALTGGEWLGLMEVVVRHDEAGRSMAWLGGGAPVGRGPRMRVSQIPT